MEYVPQKAEGDDVFENILGWGFGGPGWCINRQFQVYDEGSFGFHGSNAEPERSVSRGSESGVSELSATETDGRDLALSLVRNGSPLLVTSPLSLVFQSQGPIYFLSADWHVVRRENHPRPRFLA